MNEAQQQQQTYNFPPAMLNDFLSKDEIDLLKRTLLKQFPEDEQTTFVRLCQRTRLDPFTKQIYATRRYQKVRDNDTGATRKIPTLVPVTGIMGLCAVADRTGHYDGCEIFWAAPDGEWKTEWLSDEYPAAAKAIVYHRTRKHPEVAIARWFSFVGQVYNYQTQVWEVGDFWAKMPDYMLAKVAKAAALRGAFPDQLSNIYIKEELEGNLTDSEEVSTDEQKVAASQRKSAEVAAHPPIGVTIVAQTGQSPPTPAEALEPAFPEDKAPEKPKAPPAKPQVAQAPEKKVEPPDELDMSPPKTQEAEAPAATTAEAPPDLSWKEHVIKSVDHPKFRGRKAGELNARELTILETQWMPVVLEDWDNATMEQQADANAFKMAISFSKQQKPW